MGDKLIIKKGTQSGSSFSFSETLFTCEFNPTDYTVNKSVDFNTVPIPGLDSPLIQFKQGQAQSITLKFLLDTYTNEDATKKDVRKVYVEKLEQLVSLNSELHAPPPCQIIWGTLNYKGFVEKLDKNYILFNKSGIPVRAWVTLTIKEYISIADQLKKAGLNSPDKRKLFVVKEGDTIWQIAYKQYGDAAQWRAIAEANKLHDPIELAAGKEIIIPVLDASNRR